MKPKANSAQKIRTMRIHGLTHDGRGLGVLDNKTTFVEGALPSETITCRRTKSHSTYAEAELITVEISASVRQTPPCPHFSICGGCNLQHMPSTMQRDLKQKTLLEQLKHFGKVEPLAILPPLTASTIGYRRKARLGVRYSYKNEKMIVGFREKGGRYLADIESCAVLHASVGQQLPAIASLLRSLENYETIPQIEVAIGDLQVSLIIRHMTPFSIADEDKLRAFAKLHDFWIVGQPNSPLPLKSIWPIAEEVPYLSYQLPDYNLTLYFQPLDFTQVNFEINRLMIKQAIDLFDIQATDRILDLFCGIGNFSLPLATQAAEVVGVEGSADMIMRAAYNAEANNLKNTHFFTQNLCQVDLTIPWLKKPFDKILLDPPRTGAKELLPILGILKAPRIIYVSCNPATLARDAGELVNQHGYQLSHVGILDMFPHTAHIEAMAVFDLKN